MNPPATATTLRDQIKHLLHEANQEGANDRIFNGLTPNEYAAHFNALPRGPVDRNTYEQVIAQLNTTHPLGGEERGRAFGAFYHGRITIPDRTVIDPLGISDKNWHVMAEDPGCAHNRLVLVYFGLHHGSAIVHAAETRTNPEVQRLYHPKGTLDLHL